jgi:CubicO group peptidase (beta-lactamase class C family)
MNSHKFSRVIIGSAALVFGLKWLADRASQSKSPAGAAPQPSPFAALDAYIQSQMNRLNIPGAALAIVEGDRIVHTRMFGKAFPGGQPPTPQTPFFIGSLTNRSLLWR